MPSLSSLLSVLLAFAVAGTCLDSRAEEVVVMSSVAAKSALELIIPEFERTTGPRVNARYGTAADLKGLIEKGALCDVALLTAAAVDELIKQGKLALASRTPVFKSGVGVAGRQGTSPPHIASSDEFKSTLLSARSIA